MTMNSNQFEQTAIKGSLDLSMVGSGVITGVVSADQSGNIYPGDRVALDTAAGSKVPSFITVANTVAAIGVVAYTSKKSASNYAAGDAIEVVLLTGKAAIMYCESSAAIDAQAAVEWSADQTVATKSSGKQMGIALDGASGSGELIRVILAIVTL